MTTLTNLPATIRPAMPFAVLGTACVIAGGLVAAATAPHASEHASWAAAYLVLVAGVTQVAIGVGQALLAPPSRSHWGVVGELAAWNAGNAAVLAGTLAEAAPVVDAGGVLLAAALVRWLVRVRGPRPGGRWGLRLYRLLMVLVLVSIPVGLFLLHAPA